MLFTRLLDSGAQQAAIYYSIVATEIVKKVTLCPELRKKVEGAKLTRSCIVSHCARYRY